MASSIGPTPTVAVTAHPDNESTTGFLSTPNAVRTSNTLGGSEHALASSPILGGGELSPLRALNERPSARSSYRNSTGSSFRLSKELADLRWDGSPLKEDDSMFSGDDASRRGYQAGSESEGDPPQVNISEQVTYSTLSKRADVILANAKKRLNLLEGNLGRARHSLVIAPHNLSELDRSNSTTSTQSAPFAARDEERIAGRGPKITFGAPRSGIPHPGYRNGRTLPGHNRVFSDTSIPSPSGMTTAGSRSLELSRNRDFGAPRPLLRKSLDIKDNNLGSVPEDQTTEDTARVKAIEDESASRRSSVSSDKDLQTQAEQLRSRISYLQSRSRDSSLCRRSLNGDFRIMSAHAEEDESDLEAASRQDEPNVTTSNHFSHGSVQTNRDPRAEWQRVLEERADGSDDSASYIGEDDYSDAGKLPDALADELLDEDDADGLDQPHETRNDAFDYEHFILHSVMGGRAGMGSSRSSTSTSTEHAWEDDVMTAEEAGWIDSSQLNEQAMEPAEEADRSESDTGSERDDVRESLYKSWPVPPSTRSSKNGASLGHGRDAHKGSREISQSERRPESEIVSKLIAIPQSRSMNTLASEDKALFYAVAESLREVCMRLQHGNLGPHDGVDLRQRLEIARRVLKGEL